MNKTITLLEGRQRGMSYLMHMQLERLWYKKGYKCHIMNDSKDDLKDELIEVL